MGPFCGCDCACDVDDAGGGGAKSEKALMSLLLEVELGALGVVLSEKVLWGGRKSILLVSSSEPSGCDVFVSVTDPPKETISSLLAFLVFSNLWMSPRHVSYIFRT